MQHSGIGGGGFMLVRDSKGNYESIGKSLPASPHVTEIDLRPDFREIAPAAAFENMFEGNRLGSIFSGLSAAVPGDVKGLEYLHQKYGVRPIIICVPSQSNSV